VVISASHNPYYDNGIKFFSASGDKLPDDVEAQIEAMVEEPMTCVRSEELGRAKPHRRCGRAATSSSARARSRTSRTCMA
jgi:phosphomannomutase